MNYRLSTYSIVFNVEYTYLIFNTRSCSFYKITEDAYDFLRNIEHTTSFSDEEMDFVQELIKKHIISSREEDNDYFEDLRFQSNILSFSESNLGLTIAPTVQCNLRCPYCFEESKPKGIMSKEVCDSIMDFIVSHASSKFLDVTWFGGEPLLGVEPIRYLMSKFIGLTSHEFRNNTIISNGTLISGKTLKVFEKKPLTSAQITFDGLKDTHDLKRKTAANHGTFSLILKNIKTLYEYSPETRISLRVNIDKNNAKEFIDLREMLLNELSHIKNLNIYPAIVRGDFSCNNSLLNSADQVAFFNELSKNGIQIEQYPIPCNKGCTATHISSYVIGPKGELYLCWEHVGKPQYIVGNVKDGNLSNNKLFRQYRMGALCFDDEKCQECALLPICDGGCPDKRIDNAFRGGTNNLCNIYHTDNNKALHQLLYNIYKRYYENRQ